MYYVTNTVVWKEDKRMKQWNGLLKKEWSVMSGQFYATIVASILFTLLIPFGSTLFNWGLNGLMLSFVLSIIWVLASLFIPTIMLLISLGKEMNRPDIWLHSTASIFKLFGSKTVFAGFVGFVNMAIPMLVIIVESRYIDLLVDFQFNTILELWGLLFFILYMVSLPIMCTGLLFGVLYQLIKPMIKGFSGPVVVILFLFSSWVLERVTSTTIYEKMTSLGPVIGLDKSIFKIAQENHFFEIDVTVVHTGPILMDVLFAVFSFIIAVVLFEKKVRI